MVIVVSGVVVLGLISLLYVLLALGLPLGFLAWGGKHPKELPNEMRIQTTVSVPAQWFAIFVLLKQGNVISGEPGTIVTVFAYVFMVFFLINSVMNVLSKSKYEKMIMTPLALWVSFTFIYALFIM